MSTEKDQNSLPTDYLRSGKVKIHEGNLINALIRRKFRSAVYNILLESSGQTFAESNWEYWCDRIIKAHLVDRYPDQWSRAMEKEQVEKLKKDFPVQLKFLDELSNLVDSGKEEAHIIAILKLK